MGPNEATSSGLPVLVRILTLTVSSCPGIPSADSSVPSASVIEPTVRKSPPPQALTLVGRLPRRLTQQHIKPIRQLVYQA